MVRAVRSPCRPYFVLALALAGCPQKSGDTTADPTATGTSTSGTSGATTSGVTTSGTSTGGTTTGTTTTTGETTTGTTGGEPQSVCDPQPQPVLTNFLIDDTRFFSDDLDSVHHCTVASLDQADSLVIALSGCKVDPDDPVEQPVMHTIVADMSPAGPIDLQVGEAVVFSLAVRFVWWENHFFTLRRPTSEILLAGLSGDALPGTEYSPPLDFFAPFLMERLETCPLEPIPPPEPSGFIMMPPCFQLRRETVRVQWSGGETVDLIDHSAQTWPDEPYQVVVERAEGHADLGSCSDTPSAWFSLMFMRTTG